MDVLIKEQLGLKWMLQPMCIDAVIPHGQNPDEISVYIDGKEVPSDIFTYNEKTYASFAMALEPFSTPTISTGIRRNTGRFYTFDKKDGLYSVQWLGRKILLPATGLYDKDYVPAFLVSMEFKGIQFIEDGKFLHNSNGPVMIDTDIVLSGFQYFIARINYSSEKRLLYSVQISINGQFPEINVHENMKTSETTGTGLVFSHEYENARAKLHTPKLRNHRKDFWERVEFSPADQENTGIRLQPFYAWGVNSGSYLSLSNGRELLNIVPVNAAGWRSGRKMELEVHLTGSRAALETKGVNCEGRWVISVIGKEEDYQEIEPVSFTGGYNNYYYQIDKKLDGTYYAERLIATGSSQNIGKLLTDLRLDCNDDNVSSGVLLNRSEMALLPGKYRNDSFIRQAADAHAKSVLGTDLAGEYLLSNDESTAVKLANDIKSWFKTRIGLFFNLGYSSVHLECIALSRPLRDVAIDLDIIGPAIDPDDRKWLYDALAYLTGITGDRDYWPDDENGFDMGNRNFHSDMYACLGVCACVLNGHKKSREWIDYAEDEFEKELESSIYPGGAWAEAPTYQLASLSHLLVLAAALKNTGHRDFFKEPKLRETMLFLSSIQTPQDPRCGYAMIPSVGDTTSNILTQSWQALFAWVAKNTHLDQPEFSALMMRAWVDGGSMRIPFSYNSGLKLALAMIDPNLPVAGKREYKSSHFPGFGVVLNKVKEQEHTGYVAIKAGEINNHYDHDEGTFIWYSNKIPLLIDYGTQYNPGVDQSFWHNRISIDHKSDWCRGNVTELVSNDEYDYMKMNVIIDKVQEWPEYPDRDPGFSFRQLREPYSISPHSWTRELVYLKEIDSLLLMDDVKGSLPYDWNLHILSDDYEINDDSISFLCLGNTRLDVRVFGKRINDKDVSQWEHRGLDETRIPLAWRDYSWMWDREITAMGERTNILRIKAEPSTGVIALLSAGKGTPACYTITTEEGGRIISIEEASGRKIVLNKKEGFHYSIQNGESDG